MNAYFSHPEQLIGGTPLVRVIGMGVPEGVTVALKCEWMNPGGSIKDRTAYAMVEEAESSGALQPGGTIVEPTSGNTGVGLAMLAAQRGYRCVLVCTDKVAPDKVRLMRAHGAEVVVCPVAVAPDDPRSYYSVAARLTLETPGAWSPNQYANQENVRAHETTTGPEIWDATSGKVTHVVASAGTGGTVTGLSRFLKSRNPSIEIVAADAEGSVYSGGDGRPYLVEGPGEDFWPATYDPNASDAVVAVSDADAFSTARAYAATNGILIGGSGGSALRVALDLAATAPDGSFIVAVAPDSGRAYLSRLFDDEWMALHGFAVGEEPEVKVADVLAYRPAELPALVRLPSSATASAASSMMQALGLSRIVVSEQPPPLTPSEVAGVVTAADVAAAEPSTLLGSLLRPPPPMVGERDDVSVLRSRLAAAGLCLVAGDGRVRSVVTTDDLEAFDLAEAVR
jgi:cystathionine beta-synthase